MFKAFAKTKVPQPPLEPEDQQIWKRRYEALKRNLEKAHQTNHPGNCQGEELRRQARQNLPTGFLAQAHMEPQNLEIVEISPSGASFHAKSYIRPGVRLILNMLGLPPCGVEVLSCNMEPVNESLMEYRYRVRTRFDPRTNGYQAAVLCHEMLREQARRGAQEKPSEACASEGPP